MIPAEQISSDALVRRNEIQEFVARVASRFHPSRIILFGSHAYGLPSADSDVDLLVVMPHEGEAWMKAAGTELVFAPALR